MLRETRWEVAYVTKTQARWVRRRADWICVVLGLAVLGLGMIAVRNGTVTGFEKSIFRAINDLPQALYRPLWPLQQAGNLLVGPVVALVAFVLGYRRLAAAALVVTVMKLVLERIVKAMVSLGQPAALSKVADAAKMHPAKVRRYMVSFIRGGLIKQHPETGRYDLGPYGLDFSLAYLERLDAHKLGASVLNTLVDQLKESAFVAVWGTSGATVINWQSARQPVYASTRIGTVFPLLGRFSAPNLGFV